MGKARRPDTPFWVDRAEVAGDLLRLDAEESHHLLHVHRAPIGAPFQAVDGEGTLYECTLESLDRRSAVGRVLERRAEVGELKRPIHLLVGLPDWGSVEQLVGLAVPLGVRALDFVRCGRSEGRAPGNQRLARLTRIARAGVKQSRRTRLPELRFSGSLGEALGPTPHGTRIVADPEGKTWGPETGDNIQLAVILAVGPPGGFTEGEARLLSGEGFLPISLGPNRLLTETAALCLLSIARNHLL